MAAVISDFHTEPHFRGHTMLAGSGQHPTDTTYRQRSRSKPHDHPPPSPRPQPTHLPDGEPPPCATARVAKKNVIDEAAARRTAETLPSPPSSSSPKAEVHSETDFVGRQDASTLAEPSAEPQEPPDEPNRRSKTPLPSVNTNIPAPRTVRSLDDVKNHQGNTIKVRDLAHIQSFATEYYLSFGAHSSKEKSTEDTSLKYEISAMPITDIIEMVAGLLTKITTTNDRQHENLHRPTHISEGSSNLPGLSSSVLAFHGKNVPSITILSYLSRIHKYCPTTYEVFLSLLVYFDRMTERVNAAPTQVLRQDTMQVDQPSPDTDTNLEDADGNSSRPSTSYSAAGSDLADSPEPQSAKSVPEIKDELEAAKYTHTPAPEPGLASYPLSHFFVVDSFNIHRLVIAGVTCASKFFSDVFYTNSRYAKVSPVFFLSSFFHLPGTLPSSAILDLNNDAKEVNRLEVFPFPNSITSSYNSSS